MRNRLPLSVLVMTLLAAPPSHAAPPGGGHHHGHKHDKHGAGAHGNPEDLDGYIARMEEPSRAAWQKPDEVVRALGLSPGQTVCDVGAGPGYFALRLAKVVGERGHVFAVDVEPRMLAALRERLTAAGARNVTPVLALGDDPLLPPASCDLILVVDTYHHFLPDGAAYLRKLTRALRPGGRIANIDFHKRENPVGPPVDHLIAREDFRKQAEAAGLEVVKEHDFLLHQYFFLLRPRAAAGAR